MEKIWIRNGIIVGGGKSYKGDVLCTDGLIEKIGSHIGQPQGNVTEINASGNYIFPGAIDPHVHLALPTPAGPSSDDFYTGTKAALLGGTTSIIDFVTPARDQSLIDALQLRKLDAAHSLIDYSFHMGISSVSGSTFDEMRHCVEVEGITSFKAYLAYRDTIGIDYRQLEQIMSYAYALNAILCVHCEDGPEIKRLQQQFLANGETSPVYHALSRPPATESKAVDEVIRLAAKTNCTVYLVHMSTKESLDAIRRAKAKNIRIYAESCPQYLLLDEALYKQPLPESLAYILSPPLRSAEHRDAIAQGVIDKTLDVISTDHCPFNIKGQKDIGINDFTKVPNGGCGIQSRLGMMYSKLVASGLIPVERFVDIMSEAPARIFGLWPRKASLAIGADADIVVWNPAKKTLVHGSELAERCDHSTFEGSESCGSAEYVVCKGELLVCQGVYRDKHKTSELIFRT